jgi:cytochrome P450/NADPH-cytochrome P450 reductase
MLSTADEVIAGRRRAGLDGKVDDLLQKMLDGLDPVSNEGLDDQNIRYNMITFLIAG